MSVDHATNTDTQVETADKPQAHEQLPPPPRDQPGAEGTPSRAESRAAAAASTDTRPGDTPQSATPDRERGSENQAEASTTPEQSTQNDRSANPRDSRESEPVETTDRRPADLYPALPADQPGAEGFSPRAQSRAAAAAPIEESSRRPESLPPAETLAQGRDAPTEYELPATGPEQTEPRIERDRETDSRPSSDSRSVEDSEDRSIDDRQQAPVDQPGAEGLPSRADSGAAAQAPPEDSSFAADTPPGDRAAEPTGNRSSVGVEDRSDSPAPPQSSDSSPHDAVSDPGEKPETGDQPGSSQPAAADTSARRPPDQERGNGSDDQPVNPTPETGEPTGQPGARDEHEPTGTAPDVADPSPEPLAADAEREGTDEERQPTFELMVDGRQTNVYVDLPDVGEASNEVGDPLPDPTDRTGDRIANPEDEDESRPERARRKFYDVVEDAHDVAGKSAKLSHDVFKPPPTSQAETRSGPEMTPTPREGVNASDATTGAMVAGILVFEFGRWIGGKLNWTRGRDDGRNG